MVSNLTGESTYTPMLTFDEISKNRSISEPIKIQCKLPEEVNVLDKSCIDLLHRLLEIKPQYRLRSLLSLERIAFYKGYSFSKVRSKKVKRLVYDKLTLVHSLI